MKEEIEQFKKDNGNIMYSTKELVQALHIKMDIINERLAKGDVKFGRLEGISNTRGVWLKWLIPALFSCMGGLLMLILKLHRII